MDGQARSRVSALLGLALSNGCCADRCSMGGVVYGLDPAIAARLDPRLGYLACCLRDLETMVYGIAAGCQPAPDSCCVFQFFLAPLYPPVDLS